MDPNHPASQDSPSSGPVEPKPSVPPGQPVPRSVAVSLLSVLSIDIGFQATGLWKHWRSLGRDVAKANESTVVAYPNVYPSGSLAARPENWVRREGDSLLLWAGWDRDKTHHWFRAGRGDLDAARISAPAGRDVIVSIDDPMTEIGGGSVWERLPSDSQVVATAVSGTITAYPLGLLKQVCVVNDAVDDHPYVVGLSSKGTRAQSVTVYDARLSGHRIVLGTAGFALEGRPVLYDHETESLWVEDGDALRAVTGEYKDRALPLILRATPVAWGPWRTQNPQARLVVGAQPRRRAVAAKPL